MNYLKQLGQKGEILTQHYLKNAGYTILEKNLIIPPFKGEIDIIAKKNNIIAFVEVKTRTNNSGVTPNETVPIKKQNTIINLAKLYMQKESLYLNDFIIRFDIAYIENNILTYYENAFNEK